MSKALTAGDGRTTQSKEGELNILDDYIKSLEERIADEKKFLKPLEDGTMHLGTRPAGSSEWIDITQQHIEQCRTAIATYERIVAEAKANTSTRP